MEGELNISLLKQREIEATIVGPIFRAFAKELGEAKARDILANVIRELAGQTGKAAAEQESSSDLSAFSHATQKWKQGGALELEVIRQDDKALDFNVTRCRYAEMYERLGMKDLGNILSCGRDAAMITGFNPDIELTRTQTIMEGASHCDFRYRHKSKKAEPER